MNSQKDSKKTMKRNIGMITAILLGIVLILLAPLMKSPPKQSPVMEVPVHVQSLLVSKLDIVPRVTGFGRVTSGRTWESVAEIAGQIIWVDDELRDGNIIKAGTELLKIEDSNYRLVLAQFEAQLLASEIKRKTARDSLSLAEKNLQLLESEFKRQKQLAAKGTVSKNALDNSQRQLLTGQSQVTNLQNSEKLIIAEHKVLIAQTEAAKLDLQRTVKIAPFDVRITTVSIGIAQYANKGQLMFTADGLDVAEIEAQFSIGVLRPLIQIATHGKNNNVRAGATFLNADVYLQSASHTIKWEARVDRVAGNVDPQTQTIGVIVAVDHPYALANPGERPPLMRDTFVKVELSALQVLQQIVIPRSALHNGKVFIIDSDSRLEIRKVDIDFEQQNYAVIAKGLTAGERIVTSDLMTGIGGMLLSSTNDTKSMERLIRAMKQKVSKK